VGRGFRIARDFVGSYDHGYVEPVPASIELGSAVAASAAFPGSASVVWLETADLGLPEGAPPVLSLVDGGVYDNLGLEWFQGWKSGRPASANRPDFVIVVDASGQLAPIDEKIGSLKSVFRDLNVQYAQTLNVRVRWFLDKANDPAEAGGVRGVYIGIRHDPRARTDPAFAAGALPGKLVERLALLRTDLDRFLPEEADLLSYHGYWSLHARLKTIAPELAVDSPAWQPPGYAQMPDAEVERLAALLERGAGRAFSR
jgi:hypothetical protein